MESIKNDIPAGSNNATPIAQETDELRTYINGLQFFPTSHEKDKILNSGCDRSLLKKSLTNDKIACSMLRILPDRMGDSEVLQLCRNLGLSHICIDDIEKEEHKNGRQWVRAKQIERVIGQCGRYLTPERIFTQDFSYAQLLKDILFDEFAKQLKKLVDDTPNV